MGGKEEMTSLEMTALSSDGELLARLATWSPLEGDTMAAGSASRFTWQADAPERVPGAVESIWQLLVDVGIIAAPVSVVCNLIASWIWAAHEKAPRGGGPRSSDILLLLDNGERNAEVRIVVGPEFTKEAIAKTVEAAVTHVHPER
jgi:hypothetical protein